ncbi:hypothetical protein [Kribbella sp. NPDC050470]|uniref:hypothetical protein n=1 Tax=unclassified Kribbella TaxID=2644121 RepID=UPI0037B16A5F
MNLDDLRGELRTRSREADRNDPDLFPGIQRKIRIVRRRSTGVIVGAAAVVAALALAAPALLDHDGARPNNPVDRPTPGVIVSPPPGDVLAAGVTYRKTFGGRTLLAAVIGEPGQDSITLRWKVSTTNIVLYQYCADPGAPQPSDTPNELPWVALSRERGPLIMTGPCTPPSSPDPVVLPVDSYARGLANLEQRRAITVGSTLALTFSFKKSPEPGGMEPSSRVRLALAIYERGEERHVAGHELQVVEEIDGTTYRLAAVKSAAVRQGATVSVPTPADRRFVVRLGGSDFADGVRFRMEGIDPEGRRYPWVDQNGSFPAVGPFFGPVSGTVDARPAGVATARVVSAPTSRGTMYIAVYEPVR